MDSEAGNHAGAGGDDPREAARQRKRLANAKHRAKVKAAAAEAQLAVEAAVAKIEEERRQAHELGQEHAAMAATAEYQAEAVHVLSMAALADSLEAQELLWSLSAALTAHQASSDGSVESGGSMRPQLAGQLSAGPDAAASSSLQQRQQQLATSGSSGGSTDCGAAGAVAGDTCDVPPASELVQRPLADRFFEFVQNMWRHDKTFSSGPTWLHRLIHWVAQAVPKAALVWRHTRFLRNLQYELQRWTACPADRKEIEVLLSKRIADRLFIVRALVQLRPADVLEVWSHHLSLPQGPPGPDGQPQLHNMLLPIAHFLEDNLTAEQMVQLEACWWQYQQRVVALRQAHAAAAAQLQHAAAQHSLSWHKLGAQHAAGSSAEMGEAFCVMASSSGCLSTLAREELLAVLDLQAVLCQVLTPVQLARTFLAAQPYCVDLTQLCPWLCARRAGAAGVPPPPPEGTCAAAEPFASGWVDADWSADFLREDGDLLTGMGLPPLDGCSDAGHLLAPACSGAAPGRP